MQQRICAELLEDEDQPLVEPPTLLQMTLKMASFGGILMTVNVVMTYLALMLRVQVPQTVLLLLTLILSMLINKKNMKHPL